MLTYPHLLKIVHTPNQTQDSEALVSRAPRAAAVRRRILDLCAFTARSPSMGVD